MTVELAYSALSTCPDSGVYKHLSDVFVIECGESFVTGTEIEYLSVAAFKAASAAEKLAAREPACKYNFVGIGNIKMFAICFFAGKLEKLGKTCRDGMRGLYCPDAFEIARFAPLDITGGSHKLIEYL